MGLEKDEIGRLEKLSDGDGGKAVVEFRAAAGGSEAEIWANDLLHVSHVSSPFRFFGFVFRMVLPIPLDK